MRQFLGLLSSQVAGMGSCSNGGGGGGDGGGDPCLSP